MYLQQLVVHTFFIENFASIMIFYSTLYIIIEKQLGKRKEPYRLIFYVHVHVSRIFVN